MGESNQKKPLLGGQERIALLQDLTKKINALNNPVKLAILSLLIEAGSLSVTDISKKLNINFSTAHKYLELLEKAGIVTSRQVFENRLKRMFFVKDFHFEISPASLFKKNVEVNNNHRPAFKFFDNRGRLIDFDEDKFVRSYVRAGMPRGTIILALQEMLPHAYDGITLAELRVLFKKAAESKAETIEQAFNQLDREQYRERTFKNLLQIVHPEALEMHRRGEIFIRNLQEPKLFNFIHDLVGIADNGLNKLRPRNAKELLAQLLDAIEQERLICGSQTLHNFCSTLNRFPDVTQQLLKSFFEKIESQASRVLLDIDADNPKLRAVLESGKYQKVVPCIDCRDKAWMKASQKFDEFYVLNRKSCSLTEFALLTSEWRGEKGLMRVGEIQEIAINTLKLALAANSKKEFFEALQNRIKMCSEFHKNAFELVLGTFYRKHAIHKPSASQDYWTYAVPHDFVYSISLANLSDTVSELNLSSAELNSFLRRIFSTYVRSKLKSEIRLCIKQNTDPAIDARFRAVLNYNKKHNINLKLPIVSFRNVPVELLAAKKPGKREVWHVKQRARA